jgi:hypothetical protein
MRRVGKHVQEIAWSHSAYTTDSRAPSGVAGVSICISCLLVPVIEGCQFPEVQCHLNIVNGISTSTGLACQCFPKEHTSLDVQTQSLPQLQASSACCPTSNDTLTQGVRMYPEYLYPRWPVNNYQWKLPQNHRCPVSMTVFLSRYIHTAEDWPSIHPTQMPTWNITDAVA